MLDVVVREVLSQKGHVMEALREEVREGPCGPLREESWSPGERGDSPL